MSSKISLALITTFLFALVSVSFAPHAEAAGEGVHPWDRYNRRPSNSTHKITRRNRNSLVYDNPYFRRTQTHALHPYYRNNYHTLLDVGDDRRTDFQREIFLSGFPFYRVPSATECGNHSYYKPNYRTPPNDFRCIRF